MQTHAVNDYDGVVEYFALITKTFKKNRSLSISNHVLSTGLSLSPAIGRGRLDGTNSSVGICILAKISGDEQTACDVSISIHHLFEMYRTIFTLRSSLIIGAFKININSGVGCALSSTHSFKLFLMISFYHQMVYPDRLMSIKCNRHISGHSSDHPAIILMTLPAFTVCQIIITSVMPALNCILIAKHSPF